MYDPARDIFTSSDDAFPHPDEAPERGIENKAKTPELQEQAIKDHDHKDQGPAGRVQRSNVAEAGSKMDDSSSPAVKEDSSNTKVNDHGGVEASPPTKPPHESRKRSRSPDATPKADERPSPTKRANETEQEMPVESTESKDDIAVPATKRQKTSPTNICQRFTRKKRDPNEPNKARRSRSPSNIKRRRDRSRSPISRRRSRSPDRSTSNDDRRDRRFVQRRRSPSPAPLRRSPTPPPRSPPRKLKRPGGASRISAAEKEVLRKRQEERERAQAQAAQVEAINRGTHDVVREHYNAVPERGRDWRKIDSKIRGLRSFNNWVKSAIIQKFSPNEDYMHSGSAKRKWAEGNESGGMDAEARKQGLFVLDMGCGKGGDLGKWQQAPQPVELYIGVDPADVSIEQARDRYREMRDGGKGGGRGGRWGQQGRRPLGTFQAEFFIKDAFAEWLGDIPRIKEVGIDGSVGGGASSSRWGGGGFDVVSMMFCMHYAFESEAKVRGMLRNVAGSLKKGGRFLGVIPNSDVMSQKAVEFHKRKRSSVNGDHKVSTNGVENGNGEKSEETTEESPALEWGNSIYRVRFPGKTPEDGIFRPPYGWKYSYFMREAVEGVPEYVVPWEAFRALTEEYNLELQYRRPFADVWKEEKDDPILGRLSERMGVRERDRGPLLVSEEEMEAANTLMKVKIGISAYIVTMRERRTNYAAALIFFVVEIDSQIFAIEPLLYLISQNSDSAIIRAVAALGLDNKYKGMVRQAKIGQPIDKLIYPRKVPNLQPRKGQGSLWVIEVQDLDQHILPTQDISGHHHLRKSDQGFVGHRVPWSLLSQWGQRRPRETAPRISESPFNKPGKDK
ncbi:MAG: mRNA cap guanine-N7 methyltransferase [Peltula sp. TS41687]|nr:MAG: mRNA cap guanine-N7 methyltransferase [Peltula sp. TS41687]